MITHDDKLLELIEEMKDSPEVYRLSPFWDKLAAIHLHQLEMGGFQNFKRNVSLKYFHFSVLGIIRHELHPVLWYWCRNPDTAIFKTKLSDYRPRPEHGMQGFNAITALFYRLWVGMLWNYVSGQDRLGILKVLNEPRVGNPFPIHHKGQWISEDLCNSVHEFYRAGADTAVDGRPCNVAELGAGYGRLAHVFLRALPSASYCIIDVHPALLIAQQYLAEVFPEEKIFRFRRFNRYAEVQAEFESSRIRFLSANQIELIPPKQFDLFVNISSLHEMTYKQIENYLLQISRLCRGRFYTKQWRVSRATENGFVIKETEYPIPESWTKVYHRQHPLQRMFFEALYDIGDAPLSIPTPPVALCRVCGALGSQIVAEHVQDYITKKFFDVRRCPRCHVAFTFPQPASMDPYYPPYYRRYGPLTRTTLKLLYKWRARSWVRAFGTRGTALEIGCGPGWMLRALRSRGWRVLGNERTIQSTFHASPSNRLPVFVGSLGALKAEPCFDLIILFQVLEHLPDPFATLQQCAKLLKPGGGIVVAVPNLESWQARFARRFWFGFDVPRHLFHFSTESLAHTLQEIGLSISRIRFASLEHDPYGWAQSTLNMLGFQHNLLTKVLMGTDRRAVLSLGGLAMSLMGAILVIPSLLVAITSWLVGAGAQVEILAVKPPSGKSEKSSPSASGQRIDSIESSEPVGKS